MKAFKVVLKVVLGVAFWGYILALMFFEGTYHPFMKKDADTVVEKQQPAAAKQRQVHTQVRPQAPAARTGISIYTSTDSENSYAQQLYFSGVATKAEAIKSAAAKCQRNIVGHESYLKCKEVTFFTQGCYARYRISSGHVSSVRPTAVEAQTKAKQSCDVMAEDSSYSCILDATICIEGSIAPSTRSWKYAAFGITETMDISNNAQSVTVEKTFASSSAAAKNIVEDYCLSTSGKPCRKMYTISGDQCVAIAISGARNFAVRFGPKKNKTSLIASAKTQCGGKGIRPYDCVARFFCAGN